MPLPDPYVKEPAVQLSPDLVDRYINAIQALEKWKSHVETLRAMIEKELGDAHAGMVGDRKVITYRPTETYAVSRIRNENPELAQHFEHEVTKVEFDLAAFKLQHADIAEQYRSRQFRAVAE